MYSQLGGSSGVKQLVNAFGVNVSKSATLTKVFDAAAIADMQLGLTNEIAKASGMAPPNAGKDLMSTLSGKGLDAAAATELTSALSSAADQVKLPETSKAAVVGLLTPITTSLLGGK
jgi:truncated hemoglobin YjbI